MTNYHMNIEGDCLVCGEPATRILNIRMRREDTGASFGPNLDPAVFCAIHGDLGGKMTIAWEPNQEGEVRFVVSAGRQAVEHVHPMRDGHPGQETLL